MFEFAKLSFLTDRWKLEFWVKTRVLVLQSKTGQKGKLPVLDKTASSEFSKWKLEFWGIKTRVLIRQRAFQIQSFSEFQNSQFSLITASFELIHNFVKEFKTRVLMCYTENWFFNSWKPPVLDQHLQFWSFKDFHQVFTKRWKLEFWWSKTRVLVRQRATKFSKYKTSSFETTLPVLEISQVFTV